jgi:NAD(P)-dependent dehydrogenase (short-subunit alcohol dehydrogenase family)
MWLLREALPTFNANAEGGVFIITSSVAGTSLSGSSMAYSVTKSAQLHLMRCLANTQGAKVRINAVLPGLLLTEWGLKYPKETIEMIKDRSALKHETYLDDCADMYVAIAENTSMTGQRIAVGEWLTS